MEILIVVVVVMLILHLLAGQSDEKNFTGRLKDCRFKEEPHRWSYNKADRLQCTECGFVAGSDDEPGEQ